MCFRCVKRQVLSLLRLYKVTGTNPPACIGQATAGQKRRQKTACKHRRKWSNLYKIRRKVKTGKQEREKGGAVHWGGQTNTPFRAPRVHECELSEWQNGGGKERAAAESLRRGSLGLGSASRQREASDWHRSLLFSGRGSNVSPGWKTPCTAPITRKFNAFSVFVCAYNLIYHIYA